MNNQTSNKLSIKDKGATMRICTGVDIFISNIPSFHMTKENEIILLKSLREIIKDIADRGAKPALMFSEIDIAIKKRGCDT